jgi:hypothetical protein
MSIGGAVLQAAPCLRCGALVTWRDEHDRFHVQVGY